MGRTAFLSERDYQRLYVEVLPFQKRALIEIAKETGDRTLSTVIREALAIYINQMYPKYVKNSKG